MAIQGKHSTYLGLMIRLGLHFGWTAGYGDNCDRYSIYWIGPVGFAWGQETMIGKDLR